MPTQSVVITGASTGIGAAAARHMHALGWRVFAAMRTPAPDQSGIHPVRMDVTSVESVAGAFLEISALLAGDPLHALVNNAGIAVAGPVELVPLDQWRQQMEVNVIGQVAVTQAFLPMLRASRGRIVNVGSIAGRSAAPLSGPYSASKFALEAISDVLRMELDGWGIQVSLIEPGPVKTPIWEKSTKAALQQAELAPPELIALYRDLIGKVRARVKKSAEDAIDPAEVCKLIEHALTAVRPKTRYPVGGGVRARLLLNHLPDRWRDTLILKALGLRG